jgi:hypothetical protein
MERRWVSSDAVRERLHRDRLVLDDARDTKSRRRVQRLGAEEPAEQVKELKPNGHRVERL